MTLREKYQPAVDSFISDLHDYATGSYLREDEKTFWEQPFDPAALPLLKKQVESFIDAADSADSPEAAVSAAQAFITGLDSFNRNYAYAVIEPEEEAELRQLIENVLSDCDVTEAALKELPEF